MLKTSKQDKKPGVQSRLPRVKQSSNRSLRIKTAFEMSLTNEDSAKQVRYSSPTQCPWAGYRCISNLSGMSSQLR